MSARGDRLPDMGIAGPARGPRYDYQLADMRRPGDRLPDMWVFGWASTPASRLRAYQLADMRARGDRMPDMGIAAGARRPGDAYQLADMRAWGDRVSDMRVSGWASTLQHPASVPTSWQTCAPGTTIFATPAVGGGAASRLCRRPRIA